MTLVVVSFANMRAHQTATHVMQAIDALLSLHAAKGATSLVSGLAVADEQPPPLTSASQVRHCDSTAMCRLLHSWLLFYSTEVWDKVLLMLNPSTIM